jgi:hypothetical protein
MFGNEITRSGIAHLTALRLNEGGIVSAVMPLPGGRVLWLVEAANVDEVSTDQRRWIEQIEAFGHEVVIGTFGDLVTRATTLIQEG